MLLVRADASAEIGAGHVMRCLALAQAWRAAEPGGRVRFAMRAAPTGIAKRLEKEGIEIASLAHDGVDDLAREVADGTVRCAVIDGYRIVHAEQRLLADHGVPLLVVDDEGESATSAATWVLNQNAHASARFYADLDPRPALLLGTRYTLLRKEFTRKDVAAIPETSIPRVVVSFGGADRLGLGPVVARALAGLGLDLDVIVGAADAAVPELPGARLHVAVEDMAALLAGASLAVVAAGSTCWELAALGVPMLVVATAENQRAVARSVERLGIGESLGDGDALTPAIVRDRVRAVVADPPLRDAWSRAGREVVDGGGAARVVDVLRGAPVDRVEGQVEKCVRLT